MRNLGEVLGRSLTVVLFFALPAAANTVDYPVACCIIDDGFGVNSTVSIPTFDPSMGQLQSATYTVQFAGALFFQPDGSGSGPVSYSATIFPTLSLGDPLDLNFFSAIIESGTMMVQNGGGLVSFSGSDQISGPALTGPPSSQDVSLQFSTSAFGSPGSWELFYDTASLDVEYSYSDPSDPQGPTDPPPPDPPSVPEPRMFWPMALAFPLIIWGQRRFMARRGA